MAARYYVSRLPGKPEGGIWKVYDRQLDLITCSCQFKEQATLVKIALMHEQDRLELKQEEQAVKVEPSIPSYEFGKQELI